MCLSRSGNRIKIIDFGLARDYEPGVETRVMFGTPEFMAPEVVRFDPIDFATDLWSVGVICYVLSVGLALSSRTLSTSRTTRSVLSCIGSVFGYVWDVSTKLIYAGPG